jgi:hypothetical protein
VIATTTAARVDRRRELIACAGVAIMLVVLRSFVFLVYERFFDSDQAVTGLMAKHLSEGRAFPLFFYGQHYMLGVQAWLAVPFFWIGGPTMAMLRMPVEMFNLGIAVTFIIVFARLGMRPVFALAAALPFIATSTALSKEMLSVLGASVEPFAYVLALWMLRRRPIPFGVLLCVGSLHREFTAFALPALAIAVWDSRRDWAWRAIARGAAAFVGMWLAIDLLKRHVSALGPSETPAAAGSLLLEAQTLSRDLTWHPARYLPRLWQVLTVGLPHLFGARPYALSDYSITSTLRVGSRLAGAAFGAALLIAVIRLITVSRRGSPPTDRRLFVYLAAIGVITILMYGTNENMIVGYPVQLRYLLFAILIPIALFAAYFLADTHPMWQWTVVMLLAVWAGANTRDNARLVREFRVAPIPAYHRDLADYLVAHGVKYAWGGYWDAYITDFFSREQVVVASTEKVRIADYQREVTEHDSESVQLVRQPCAGGASFEVWCLKGAAASR